MSSLQPALHALTNMPTSPPMCLCPCRCVYTLADVSTPSPMCLCPHRCVYALADVSMHRHRCQLLFQLRFADDSTVSSEAHLDPVVSTKSGHVYERSPSPSSCSRKSSQTPSCHPTSCSTPRLRSSCCRSQSFPARQSRCAQWP